MAPAHPAVKGGSVDVDKFRLLIIGKSGCGKTTILSKLCGEDVADAPSESRGVHNIEKELPLKRNRSLLVHDSEGFEAGRTEEFTVVEKFIATRTQTADYNKRLHAIWYCLQMGSRPIQESERLFFSVSRTVPVVAIFTKFDVFVEDQLLQLADTEPEEDEDALEEKAAEVANEKFNTHFKAPLQKMHHPPIAIVTVSAVHESTPEDSRLGNVIRATMDALQTSDSIMNSDVREQLGLLFGQAQMADLGTKIKGSIQSALPVHGPQLPPMSTTRRRLIKFWNTEWSKSEKGYEAILSLIENNIDKHPQTIGNPGSLSRPKIQRMPNTERQVCRCAQSVIDMTLIMKHVFLLDIPDSKGSLLEAIVKAYVDSSAFTFVQREVAKVTWPNADDGRGVSIHPHQAWLGYVQRLTRIAEQSNFGPSAIL